MCFSDSYETPLSLVSCQGYERYQSLKSFQFLATRASIFYT